MEEPLVHQGDDALFAAAPSIDSGADDTDDEKYVGKLQLQEVLLASFLSTTPHVHHDEPPTIHFHQVDQSMVVYIDPKGKTVIESDSPSSSKDRSKTANCGICTEEKPVADLFEIGECKAVIESDSPSSSKDRSKTANCGICTEDKPVADFFEIGECKAVIESDSPSSSKDISKTANCGICTEDKPVADFFEIGECKHEFCKECVGQYVAVKVEEKVASIRCLEPGCGVRMEMEMCQGILLPEVFERWGMAMCELMVEERFYCPFNDCSAMMMVDQDSREVIRASECPHCNRLFCAQCMVAWHGDMECSEFQALGDGERESEDQLLRNVAKDCKWQRCPECRFYVDKIDGCMLIKCRCGHGFCYSCASPVGDDHYCTKCLR